MSPNQRQITEWNGRAGDSWTIHQARFDRMLAPFGDALLQAVGLKRGEAVLDIGCGAGATALALARQGARVTGVDVSQSLIDRAKALAFEAELPASFIVADASTYGFEASFDVVVSRLGVMFFDDPSAAFANLHSALKPDGRLACLTWRGAADNEAAALVAAAAPPVVVPPRDPSAPGPFSFGDRDRVRGYLETAGFRDIAIEPFDHPMLFGEGETNAQALDDAMDMAFHIGPLRRVIDGVSDMEEIGICQRLRKLMSYRLTPRGVELKAGAWIITARR